MKNLSNTGKAYATLAIFSGLMASYAIAGMVVNMMTNGLNVVTIG